MDELLNLREVLEQFGSSAISEIQSKMSAEGANASGATSRSLRKELGDKELDIFGSSIFKYVETGRGPSRKRGGELESLRDRIKQWIKDKGITPDGSISEDSLAFLIARKIHQEGTLIYRNKTPRDIYSSTLSEQRVKSLVYAITENSSNIIKSDIIKAFK